MRWTSTSRRKNARPAARPAGWAAALAAGALVALQAGAAAATSPTCRDWQQEHRQWKARAVQLYLGGAPQRELDTALFELMQREAWLTACDLSVEGARAELVGWRLVDRDPDEYGSAVAESLLVRAGLSLELRPLFADGLADGPLRARRGELAEASRARAAH